MIYQRKCKSFIHTTQNSQYGKSIVSWETALKSISYGFRISYSIKDVFNDHLILTLLENLQLVTFLQTHYWKELNGGPELMWMVKGVDCNGNFWCLQHLHFVHISPTSDFSQANRIPHQVYPTHFFKKFLLQCFFLLCFFFISVDTHLSWIYTYNPVMWKSYYFTNLNQLGRRQ